MGKRPKSNSIGLKFKAWIWKLLYQHLAKTYPDKKWRFLNYGYAHLAGEPEMIELDEQDKDMQYSIQLYHHVASAVDLSGLKVLEVGSGRGGGADFVKRYLKPKTMIGVDFSKVAVEHSNRDFGRDGLSYQVGNAVSLPFEDDSFDAVINVESSHCYPSMEDFLGQVNRVLRSGGHFLFADLRPQEMVDALRDQLINSGLTILEEKDITPNVVAALQLDSERKMKLIEENVKKPKAKEFMMKFSGTEDSKINRQLKNGEYKYLSFTTQKI